MHHDFFFLGLELTWQGSHLFGSPSKNLQHWQGVWMLLWWLALRNIPTKCRKWSSLCCESRCLSYRDREPVYGWNAALRLPWHDLGQALWSRVSSLPGQRYDIQVGWEPCREVLSPAQGVIPRPRSKAHSSMKESCSLRRPWLWHPSQEQAGFILRGSCRFAAATTRPTLLPL